MEDLVEMLEKETQIPTADRGLTKQMKKNWKTFSNAGTGNGHAKERGFQTKSASKQFIKYHS